MDKLKSFKIVTVLLFCLSCVACNAAQDSSVISKEKSLDKKSQLENMTALQLPEKVEIKYLYETKESDQLTKSIMIMSKESFIDWIASYHLKLDNFDNEKRYLLGQNSDEWNPASLETLEVAQVNFENGKVLNIGYTIKTKEHVVVYFVFHSK